MFERLPETQPSSQIKNRKTYFLVTSILLSFGLATALVVSLFAVDLSLGSDDFNMVELVAPVEMPVEKPPLPEPEPMAEPQPRTTVEAAPVVPTRQVNMARVDESPREAPPTVSTVQNTVKERPRTGYFEIGKADADPIGGQTSGRSTDGPTTGGTGLGVPQGTAVAQAVEAPPPPPPPVKVATPAPKPPVTQTLGVINGKATNLPKPVYSSAAKAVNVQGQVSVRVLIDEDGNVVSANAVSGHPLLKASAVSAARRARFSPTLLSGTPVKITGTIIYNFSTS